MKILIYSHRIGSKTITFIHNEINELAKDNELRVLYHHKEDALTLDNCEIKKIRHYHSKPLAILLALANQILKVINIKLPNFTDDLQKEIESFKPDVIHIHFGTIAERVLYPKHIDDIPIFISFHGYDASRSLNDDKYVSRLKNIFAKDNVYPIFVSQFMENNVKHALNTDSIKNANILYYGTDLSFFKRSSRETEKEEKVFLQISSFVEKKGHIYSIEAFKLFLDNYKGPYKPKLILAGGGQLLDEIKNLVIQYGIEDHVQFPGWVSKNQAKTLFEDADYFIHHSIVDSRGDMEGIPNALMEAMAMELPVISSRHSGIPELVEDQVNGYLVKEKDVANYAKRFEDILDFDYLSINREKVIDKFELKAHKSILSQLYQKSIVG